MHRVKFNFLIFSNISLKKIRKFHLVQYMCLSQLFPQQCPTTNRQLFTTNVSQNEWHILCICGIWGQDPAGWHVLKYQCARSTRGHSLSTSCGLTGRKGLFVLLRRRAERRWDLPPIDSPPELHIVFCFFLNRFPRSPRKKKTSGAGLFQTIAGGYN